LAQQYLEADAAARRVAGVKKLQNHLEGRAAVRRLL
jgi:hypothetical protein